MWEMAVSEGPTVSETVPAKLQGPVSKLNFGKVLKLGGFTLRFFGRFLSGFLSGFHQSFEFHIC